MILRPYQQRAVSKAAKALDSHGNTIVVAPTGAGKTVILSALAKEVGHDKALILQHRDELVSQNMAKFRAVNPGALVSLYTADNKSWRGDAVFAMVQTLCRHVEAMPALDLLIVDEAHHVAASSYRKIIDRAREVNPKCKIAGLTATPMRADKKALRDVFDNCAEQITIKELIDMGFLVPPRAFVIDVGTQEKLFQVRMLTTDYDMAEVEAIMNKAVVNQEVVRHWKERAGNRKTVVFCSTIEHAADVTASFAAEGIRAEMLTGKTPAGERKAILRRFKADAIQVLVNVSVLTEGFDEPTVSCVVLLRPCSFKSTMIQMIGRGLRPVNCKEHPGVIKHDCIVLDFGTSILQHGDLDADANLGKATREHCAGEEMIEAPVEAPTKRCPEDFGTDYIFPDREGKKGCGAEVPAGSRVCPFCGFLFEKDAGEAEFFERVAMQEIDLINKSPFRWVDLFGTGRVLIASGFGTFSVVASPDGQNWSALGMARDSKVMERLAVSHKVAAIAMADDFLRQNEDSGSAKKSAGWMRQPASPRQVELLQRAGYPVDFDALTGACDYTKLTATAHLNFTWNRRQIERLIGVAA